MARKPAKKTATTAQRRAYRSVTTKKQRKKERASVGKGQYAKNVKAIGGAMRKSRKAEGTNVNTGAAPTKSKKVAKVAKKVASRSGKTGYAAKKQAKAIIKKRKGGK